MFSNTQANLSGSTAVPEIVYSTAVDKIPECQSCYRVAQNKQENSCCNSDYNEYPALWYLNAIWMSHLSFVTDVW